MKLLWATRGRDWGFRILVHPTDEEPLALYRAAFASISDEYEVFVRQATGAVLRFADPEDRRDRAGRPIPHEFVLLDEAASTVHDVDSAKSLIWPKVATTYSRIWDRSLAPALGSIHVP